jgi:hypothetical protein
MQYNRFKSFDRSVRMEIIKDYFQHYFLDDSSCSDQVYISTTAIERPPPWSSTREKKLIEVAVPQTTVKRPPRTFTHDQHCYATYPSVSPPESSPPLHKK